MMPNIALHSVVVDDQIGFIDSTGTLVIPAIFQGARTFGERYAVIRASNEKMGMIDSEGNYVIPPKFEVLGSPSCGRIEASNGDGWGYVNEGGEWAVDPIYEDVGRFSEGLAFAHKSGGLYVINTEGETYRIPEDYEDHHLFSCSRARVEKAGRIGFINTDGEEVIPPIYGDDSSGWYCKDRVILEHEGKYGIADENHHWIHKAVFDELEGWGELGEAIAGSNGKYGFITTDGAMLSGLRYDDAREYSCDRAFVKEAGSWSLIGSDFMEIAKLGPEFHPVTNFENMRSFGWIESSGGIGKYFIIDEHGQPLTDPKFDDVYTNFSNHIAHVQIDGSDRYLDLNGEIIW